MSTNPVVPIVPEATLVEPERTPPARPATSKAEIASWILIGALLFFIMVRHLVGATIVGLTLYLTLDRVSRRFSGRLSHSHVRPLTLLVVTLVTGGIVTGAIMLFAMLLRRGAGNLPDLMNQMAEILDSTRTYLGGFGEQVIPEVLTDAEDLKATVVTWLKTHAKSVRAGGLWLGIGALHIVMGVLLAVLVFFRHITKHDLHDRGPLARHLVEKFDHFADAFSRVAWAQVKISAVNTTLTGLYLLVALPLFGIKVPFGTTLVLITFICGLIPVLGNLISNTVITIVSLGISFGTAVASLTFLVVIHKLEYLINSKIVGGETESQAWEILMAIILGEAAFGIPGIVMAPIIYAFVKRELRDRALV